MNKLFKQALANKSLRELNSLIEQGYELSEEDKQLIIDTTNFNFCDFCKKLDLSEDLIWINSEDFEPRDGESISEEMHNKYEALHTHCYLDLINK